MPSPAPFWLCHECHAQMRPIVTDDVPHCASCGSEFVEILDPEINPDPTHDLPPGPPARPGQARAHDHDDPPMPMPGFLPSLFSNLFGAAADAGAPGPSAPGARAGRIAGQGNGAQGEAAQGGGRTFTWNIGGGQATVHFGTFGGPPGGGQGAQGRHGVPPGMPPGLEAFFPGFAGRPGAPGNNRQLEGIDLLQTLFAVMGGDGGLDDMPRGNVGDYVMTEQGFNDILERLMQAAGPQGPLPASDVVIEGLPRFTFDEKSLESSTYKDCPVCKDDFGVGDEVMRIPCSHIFHPECLQPWLKVNGSCPVCRFSLVPHDDQAPAPAPTPATAAPQAGPSQPALSAPNATPASPSTPGAQDTITSILSRLWGPSGALSPAESSQNPLSPRDQMPNPLDAAGPSAQTSSVSRAEATTGSTAAASGAPAATRSDPPTPDLSSAIPEDYRRRHAERERQQHLHEQEPSIDDLD
ncbi:hypothetical protein Q5752_003147 [Cryptotrichosporon argae]